MGLYLCVFDGEDEVEGVEIGSYSDFNDFRQAVVEFVENGVAGSVCPTLMLHSDSDGEWSVEQIPALQDELLKIEGIFAGLPPLPLAAEWKKNANRVFGINPKNLLQCFFDVDGEPLTLRLRELCEASLVHRSPILFQ
jgi:hypothetical protein